MAITIQAPLAAQLFTLGSSTGSQGNDKFSYQGKKPSGFHQGQLMQPPPLPQEDHSGGQAKALASIGGALAGAAGNYLNAPSTTPDSQGNGFGLGANLTSGEVGSAKYAGDEKPGILQAMMGPKEPDTMPVDNGTTPQTNPYALSYGNANQRKSLFNYGGSYGGASY